MLNTEVTAPKPHDQGESVLLRIGQAAILLGVSIDTLRRWEGQGRLTCVRRSNQRLVPSEEVTRLLLERGVRQSGNLGTPNRLTGIVVTIDSDENVARVELAIGEHRIVSLMPHDAAVELGLSEGSVATAVVNAAQVSIDHA